MFQKRDGLTEHEEGSDLRNKSEETDTRKINVIIVECDTIWVNKSKKKQSTYEI